MKIYPSVPADFLRDGILFFDNSALVALINHEDVFGKLINEFRELRCSFAIIPSLFFEFTRTDSVANYNKRVHFLKNHIDMIYPVEKDNAQLKELTVVLQRVKPQLSYTDFLLHCCMYKFRDKGFVITENHRDFSLELLDRKYIITVEDDKNSQIRNTAIYSLNIDKFNKAAENILKEK